MSLDNPYLPPLATAEVDDAGGGARVAYLQGLAQEGRDGRSDVEPMVEDNLTLYRYGKSTGAPGEDEIVVNEIQSAVIAITDVQTKEPIQATLEPVETGEKPIYYWAGPQDIGMQWFNLLPSEVAEWVDPATGATMPPTPIDEMLAGKLQAVAVPREASPALPPGATRPEWVVELNDKCVADFYQTVTDVLWERSDIDLRIEQNLLKTNVQGWSWLLYEFDETAERHVLTHLPVTQVYVDPTALDVDDAAYAGFDLPLDADKAKVAYPQFAAQIDAEKREGVPLLPDGNAQWGAAFTRSFRRPMVVLRVFWLRNQVVPLTKDDALELGLVQEIEVPVPQFVDGTTPNVGYDDEPTESLGSSAPAAGADGLSGPDAGGGVAADLGGGEKAVPGAEDAGTEDQVGQADGGVPAAQTTTVCVLASTGQPVAPGDPEWPTRLGIRQIVQLGSSTIVSDTACEFYDIPLLLNVDIPLATQSPFGLGEPFRLACLQRAESRTLTAMTEHCEFFAHPIATIAQSTADQLAKEYGRAVVTPGVTMVVPDDIFRASGGQIHNITQAPPMSTALPTVFETTKGVLQEQSGHTDALRGISNGQDSGRKVELLQSSGSSLMGFKAKRTGHMVKRLTRLLLHEEVRRLEVNDLLRIVSKYDEHIVRVIRRRALSIEWNVKVRVSSGDGQQAQKTQLALLQYQSQLISKQSAREAMGLDNAQEDQRQTGEFQKQARMGMAAMPTAQPGQPQPGGGQKPNNPGDAGR